MVFGKPIELAYQGCFAEWRSMEKGGAAVLLPEIHKKLKRERWIVWQAYAAS
jgi:hypothetical protein